jgi:tRNA-specific 2-thiouridylase
LGLITATKPDSQEICFVADGSYRTLLKDRFRERVRPGAIVDEAGAVVGEHDGIAMYTVGQRSGLRVRTHAKAEEPWYVTALEQTTNTVRVGRAAELFRQDCEVEDVRWLAGRAPEAPFRAGVKVRSHATEAGATVIPLGERARVEFHEPQRALAPGQAAVFYDGDRVVGGGPIARQAA